jgi:anti-anti-sigma factor
MDVNKYAHSSTDHFYVLTGRIHSPSDYRKLEDICNARQHGNHDPLVLDFSGITFCTSQALGILVSHARQLKKHDIPLCVYNPQDEVRETIAVSGIAEVLNCVSTPQDLESLLKDADG